MPSTDEYMETALAVRQKLGCMRKLGVHEALIDFASNDYFGWANSEVLKSSFIEEVIHSVEIGLGASGSRLITGNSLLAEQVENAIARFHDVEAALTFPSGYMANIGLVTAVSRRGDVLLRDECVHASMIDGCRLSLANSFHFKHNDLVDLETKLQRFHKQKCFVLIESLYSMEGDIAPLSQIVQLCHVYDVQLIVDEAHALGVFGGGLVQLLNLHHQVFARIVTYGKALGAQGAAILGSSLLIKYLVNFCRPFIFSTAVSPMQLYALKTGYSFLEQASTEMQTLQRKCKLFVDLVSGTSGKQLSPIQILIIPGNRAVDRASAYLSKAGFAVGAIKSPTIKKGTERLRICLHTFNADADILRLAHCLNSLKRTELENE